RSSLRRRPGRRGYVRPYLRGGQRITGSGEGQASATADLTGPMEVVVCTTTLYPRQDITHASLGHYELPPHVVHPVRGAEKGVPPRRQSRHHDPVLGPLMVEHRAA